MPAMHADAFTASFTEDYEAAGVLRYDKVRTARRRLAEGRYDREELLRAVLEDILNDMAR